MNAIEPYALCESRAVAAYVGLAIGDALGATVEFMTPAEIRAAYGVHDRIRGGGWLKLRAGRVTDDTTMALALGDALFEAGIDAQTMAQHFDAWMRAKPVDIGNTVRRGILHFRRTGDPVNPPGEHDAGNGACMRMLPVALYCLSRGDDELQAALRAQAHITHNNPLSDAACFCVARMVQQAMSGARAVDLLHGPVAALIAAHPEFRFRIRRRENPSGYIVDTVQAVFQSFFDTDNFTDCLIDVVNRGGDADTTGAIAGMLAGALYGMHEIPAAWIKALDAETMRKCEVQARRLIAVRP